METIEEIVYTSYELGIRDELIYEVCKLQNNDKYKFVPLVDIYTESF